MTANQAGKGTCVATIYRHPIKSHGREAIATVRLTKGQSMPWDRTWAVAHDSAKMTDGAWMPCQNFSRGSKAPGLMAINATLNETTRTVTLSHPDLDDLVIQPDHEGAHLITWVHPIVPHDRAMPNRVYCLDDRGFTDSDYATVSLCNLASHTAVEKLAGTEMSRLRWRGNIWLDGLEAWGENDWIGRDIRIGTTVLRVSEPIKRCLATAANPKTGERDVDTLAALNTRGNQNFGVYARVIQSGDIGLEDKVELI